MEPEVQQYILRMNSLIVNLYSLMFVGIVIFSVAMFIIIALLILGLATRK